jgi:hypothetical protein
MQIMERKQFFIFLENQIKISNLISWIFHNHPQCSFNMNRYARSKIYVQFNRGDEKIYDSNAIKEKCKEFHLRFEDL